MTRDKRQASAEIEITPEMVEAGIYAAREHALGASLRELVESVYQAMHVQSLDSQTTGERRCKSA